MTSTNPAPKPRPDLPDGRTSLVSMFPIHMDEPAPAARPTPKREPRPTARSNSMNAGR